MDALEGSSGSILSLGVSVVGLGAGFALPKKSSFPEGFGFEGSSLITGLTSFGSDLTTGLASSVIEDAFDRPGGLSLEVEVAAAEGFVFAEDRAGTAEDQFVSVE